MPINTSNGIARGVSPLEVNNAYTIPATMPPTNKEVKMAVKNLPKKSLSTIK